MRRSRPAAAGGTDASPGPTLSEMSVALSGAPMTVGGEAGPEVAFAFPSRGVEGVFVPSTGAVRRATVQVVAHMAHVAFGPDDWFAVRYAEAVPSVAVVDMRGVAEEAVKVATWRAAVAPAEFALRVHPTEFLAVLAAVGSPSS